jgi:Zn-dependent M28 family amino/carboxypeptidase
MNKFFLYFASLFFTFALFGQSQAQIVLSKPEEFTEAFKTIPCNNKERLPAVKALFLQMGAKEENISIEKIKNVENIIISRPGKTAEKIIVSAHYDLTGAGSCGATDNWTGIVTIAHLYKSLKDSAMNKTIYFVGFGKEEEGLVGSKAMAKQISKEDVPKYCANLNIDGLGMNTPQILKGASDESLQELAKETAKTLGINLEIAEIPNASSDSASFREKKIPAATISEIPKNWMEIYHHKPDQADKINNVAVYTAYRLALLMLVKIDENDCQAWRGKKKK